MALSGSLAPWPLTLAPCFVNNNYVRAEVTYSTAYARHGVLAWLWATVYSMPVWASPWKPWLLLHWGYIGATLCYGSVMVMLWPLLQLLHQPGERLCYGCCASQERINVSALPMAPRIFFQPLSSSLTYPGINEQCRQYERQDSWHHEQDQWYTHIQTWREI